MSKRRTKEEFEEESRKVHGNKYDYSKVVYVNNRTNVTITCPIHGDFPQTPENHLNGHGCKKCYYERMAAERRGDFQELSLRVGDKYSPYEPIEEFKNQHSKIYATCKIHGKYKTSFHRLLQGHGCPDCGRSAPTDVTRYNLSKYNEVFFSRHPDSHLRVLNYVRSGDPSEIECMDCNTRFWRSPNALLGNPTCPNCYERIRTFKLEESIKALLVNNSIKFENQKTFLWLKNKASLYLDFYLPDCNIAIECQGLQHFQVVDYFGGEGRFKQVVYNDNLKRDLCTEHGIRMIYYSDLGIDYPYEVIEDLDEILKIIKG